MFLRTANLALIANGQGFRRDGGREGFEQMGRNKIALYLAS